MHKLPEIGHWVQLYEIPRISVISLFFRHSKYPQKLLISSKPSASSLPWGLQLLAQEHSNKDKKDMQTW